MRDQFISFFLATILVGIAAQFTGLGTIGPLAWFIWAIVASPTLILGPKYVAFTTITLIPLISIAWISGTYAGPWFALIAAIWLLPGMAIGCLHLVITFTADAL